MVATGETTRWRVLSESGYNLKQPGFSLLEVLVAATIFSVGLAGLAALLLANIVSSADARREGVAALAASSLAESIRLNRVAVGRFLAPPEHVSRICSGHARCTPAQQADYDFKLWRLELADSLEGASGLVCHDSTPDDGSPGSDGCDGMGPLVIKVFWSGQGKEARQRRHTLEVG